ncbi:hypothetical protein CoNPh17_CDS0102 [Staphylococcus phage S-CoN_Ph17]|nr:hypothetical protein CoNPh17_CDS0102 [Staphylococcus phage S-CoN_Ph17]
MKRLKPINFLNKKLKSQILIYQNIMIKTCLKIILMTMFILIN